MSNILIFTIELKNFDEASHTDLQNAVETDTLSNSQFPLYTIQLGIKNIILDGEQHEEHVKKISRGA